MRIGYDAKRAFKNFTGLGNYSRSVINIMANFYTDNEYFLYTPPYKAHPSNKFAALPNITITRPTGIWHFFHSTWRSLQLSANIKNDRIDIYHGLSHELPAGIRNSGAKSIVTMHDLIVLRYPELYKYIDRKIYMKKYSAACRDADLIIAISEQTKRDLIDLMGIDENKIRLVYQGCDPQFYKLCDDIEKITIKNKYRLPDKFILNLGTIEKRKNLEIIVKALNLLPENIHLVAVGKPTNYLTNVEAAINKYQLTKQVHFIHNAAFADLPAIYQLSQAFVYPSVFEGFGIPILEALNSRVPVVCARSSSLPEVGGDAALYFETDDDKQLANHLISILQDNNLREQIIEKGVTQALKFREEQIAKRMWDVYTELI